MIIDYKLLIELQHIHMDARTEKAFETKLLKYKKWLTLMIIQMKIKQNII